MGGHLLSQGGKVARGHRGTSATHCTLSESTRWAGVSPARVLLAMQGICYKGLQGWQDRERAEQANIQAGVHSLPSSWHLLKWGVPQSPSTIVSSWLCHISWAHRATDLGGEELNLGGWNQSVNLPVLSLHLSLLPGELAPSSG